MTASLMTDVSANSGFDPVITAVRDRLSRNLPIRRNVPGDGRLRIDRQLPFLCIYRTPPDGRDYGSRELVTSEAAYLFASGEPQYAAGLNSLCCAISETLEEHFGTLLLIELWSEDDRVAAADDRELARPGFHIYAEEHSKLASTVTAMEEALSEVRFHGAIAEVASSIEREVSPPGMRPIAANCRHGATHRIGIAVRPVYRDFETGALFPMVLQSLRRQLAIAIRKSIFAFAGGQQERRGPARHSHYEALGPSSITKPGRLVDQQLSEIAHSFDFLLQVTPVNAEAAWEEFSKGGHRTQPHLVYRPLPYHPALLKRQLYAIPLEQMEDVTLVQLFEQKQEELGKQLSALRHVGTNSFFYDSLLLYGQPSAKLVALAEQILQRTPAAAEQLSEMVPAERIAAAAREQIDEYHQRLPDFHASVKVVNDIASALMVARDTLLVSESASLRKSRVAPLLHHEVGAHLLTYFNGRQQPLRQLYAGFAGYEALQEGLAVLSEYLSGGLTAARLRTIAARVLAVNARVEGMAFVDAFHLLHDTHRLCDYTSFITTLRAYRGGGLTKDALYLQGLSDLLEYLRHGHDLEPLYVGKIALEHVPLVQELRRRGVIEPPALLPLFWEDPAFHDRLAACRSKPLIELLELTP
jgi:uncharacterized protein (TIGR02421 family)